MNEATNMDNDGQDKLLAKVKKDLYDNNIIAFLGPPYSGKTVIATLLNDSIYEYFLKEHGAEYEANLTHGYDFLKTTRDMMLKGEFPSATLPDNQKEIVFTIARKGTLRHEIQIRIKDISGEDYYSLLISGELNAKDRVNGVLRHHKTKSMSYGPLSYIPVAKMYVIMIDCSFYSKWKQFDLDYTHLLNSLLDFQKIVDNNGQKITRSIAIILTKTDCLPEETDDSAKDLVAKQMPQFDKTLEMLHSGTREYFKLNINTDRTSSNERDSTKIKIPWSYSSDEYNRLILWILNNIS